MTDKFCCDCRYWERLTGTTGEADGHGLCHHPAAPWGTSERCDRRGLFAPCMEAQESCALHEAADGAA